MPVFQMNKLKDFTHCSFEKKKESHFATLIQHYSLGEAKKMQRVRLVFKYKMRLIELIEHRWGTDTDKDWH